MRLAVVEPGSAGRGGRTLGFVLETPVRGSDEEFGVCVAEEEGCRGRGRGKAGACRGCSGVGIVYAPTRYRKRELASKGEEGKKEGCFQMEGVARNGEQLMGTGV